MENVVPWKALINLIEPHYPKISSNGDRPPYPLTTMLRIYLLQQWYDLSDPPMEDGLIEAPMMRRFAGIDMISDQAAERQANMRSTFLCCCSFRKVLATYNSKSRLRRWPHCSCRGAPTQLNSRG
jgi:IS5 family transposase